MWQVLDAFLTILSIGFLVLLFAVVHHEIRKRWCRIRRAWRRTDHAKVAIWSGMLTGCVTCWIAAVRLVF